MIRPNLLHSQLSLVFYHHNSPYCFLRKSHFKNPFDSEVLLKFPFEISFDLEVILVFKGVNYGDITPLTCHQTCSFGPLSPKASCMRLLKFVKLIKYRMNFKNKWLLLYSFFSSVSGIYKLLHSWYSISMSFNLDDSILLQYTVILNRKTFFYIDWSFQNVIK